MNKVITAVLATGSLLAAAGSAWAGMASERISVSVNVVSTCMASSSAGALGSYATSGSPLSVRCSTASPITVTVNADTVAGGLLAARLMNSASGLPGALYTPAAKMTTWADHTGNVATTSTALTAMTAGAATYGETFGDSGLTSAQAGGTVTLTISY
ncbi:MAG: spore coat protein U domain-containing protein [Steroidobacteraceae bacterium]